MRAVAYPKLLGLLLLALPEVAAGQDPSFKITEERTRCTSYDAVRKPLFGETHAHTSYSFDALSAATNNPPSEAYEYAQGKPIWITDSAGNPTRCAQMPRPLDWAAITDHAEFLGEITLCTTPGSAEYDSQACQDFRSDPLTTADAWGEGLTVEPPQPPALCGPDNETCYAASATLWSATREAAEAAYDRSAACKFTSFVAYEWTSMPGYDNRHRNVIFRNENVPDRPVSVFETSNDESVLWERLSEECVDAGTGCEVLTIPHNGNLSDGLLYDLPPDANAAYAVERSTWEPLSEIHQGKGNSECRTGVDTEDPECGFEQLVHHNLDFIFGGGGGTNPFRPNAFLRNVLKEGLAQGESLGANPFKFGFAGGTDTHSALPGGTDEGNFKGLHGATSADVEGLLGQIDLNAGALTVVWAEENSRDSIFAALQRRETYATSGTRPTVRFYGGWSLPKGICDDGKFVADGDATGVPMGADLQVPPSEASMHFAVQAMKDPGSQAPVPLPPGDCAVYKPGAKLQRVEIVKGWLDPDGTQREKVVTVAGSSTLDPAAGVDPATCAPTGPGHDTLCAFWTDDQFDPTVPAFYYARVLENPSCRWSTYTCKEAGLDPFQPVACQARLAASFSRQAPVPGQPSPYDVFSACCSLKEGPIVEPGEIPKVVQQRAWTSPVWYTPPGAP